MWSSSWPDKGESHCISFSLQGLMSGITTKSQDLSYSPFLEELSKVLLEAGADFVEELDEGMRQVLLLSWLGVEHLLG